MGSKLLDYFNNDDLAASVWQSKYAQPGEETPDDMHKRLAKEFARIEVERIPKEQSVYRHKALDISDYGKSRPDLTEDLIFEMFKDFKYVIPQGSIMSQLGANSIGSLSNCFVIGQPEDSYGGIFEKDEQLAQLMKRRGGVGLDISTLRPEGVATSNAAKSSTGAISFMHRFSNTTREVAQNGRRGALMLSIDINHPDVLEFIKIKRDLTQVTGANISIKLNDEFMKAVENDEDYILRFPCTQDISYFTDEYIKSEYNKLHYIEDHKNDNSIIHTKTIKAKEYWDEIIKSAHGVAEPGLMFWDNMVGYSPDGIYPQFKQITTNPCSEIGMQAYDACRLIAVNLYSFVDNPFTPEAKFNFKKFYEINYEAMRLSDDLIDLEMNHITRIIRKIDADPESHDTKRRERDLWEKVYRTAEASRRTGLGFTALGDTLAALGLVYDSKEALEFVDSMMEAKLTSELDCTIDLAILRGPFIGWDSNIENNLFYDFIANTFPEQAKKMDIWGRRNVSWSTVAPTGTVSLLAQTTSGIEPLFMPFYTRRKKVNGNAITDRVDFTDQNGDKWQEYAVLHPKFKDWLKTIYYGDVENMPVHHLEEYFKQSPWYGSTANDINWVQRVEMQATIQKYITHSISSTINLPNDVSEESVSEIYLESWKKGLKGITVYRDGSRSGVLVSNDASPTDSFEYRDAPKRPKSLQADVHKVTSKGQHFTVVIGLFDEKPYEVFIEEGHNKDFFFADSVNTITKKAKGKYVLEILRGEEKLLRELSLTITDEEVALTRMISTALRHGADIKFVVEQLNKADGTIVSFSKAIARTLKKYIPDGTQSTVNCNECGSENVIFQEGCFSCKDCGNSKCG